MSTTSEFVSVMPKMVVTQDPDWEELEEEDYSVVAPARKAKKTIKEVRLVSYHLNVELRGFVVSYSAEMSFVNPFSRELEGELEFPLPDGVSVSGYALDIGGVLVDASCVTKEKGRVTLETEERKRVDPGLVEWTKGNVFKTRVYPLPADGKRTVRVDWVSTVDWDDTQDSLVCRVPLRFDSPVDGFSVDVTIADSQTIVRPEDARVSDDCNSGGGAADGEASGTVSALFEDAGFVKTDRGWTAHVEKTGFQPVKDAIIQIPHVNLEAEEFDRTADGVYCAFAVTAHDLCTQFGLKEYEFDESEPDLRFKKKTESIAVFWDCSGSRAGSAIAGKSRELSFLYSWLKSVDAQSVRLIPVRNAVDESEIQVIRTKQARAGNQSGILIQTDDVPGAVLDAIEKLPFDGASCLESLVDFVSPGELTLLFTDGLNNWFSDDVPQASVPLYVFSSGSVSDAPVMRRWASQSSGQYMSLDSQPIEELTERFNRTLKFGCLVIPLEGYHAEIYPTHVDLSTGKQVFFLAGKVDAPLSSVSFQQDARSSLSREINPPKEWFGYDPDADDCAVLEAMCARESSGAQTAEAAETARTVETAQTAEAAETAEKELKVDEANAERDRFAEAFPWFERLKNPPVDDPINDSASGADCSANRQTPIRTFFAQSKLAELNQCAAHDLDVVEEMTRLGKQYSLVTPETSLIVLESLDQYVEHGICPPRSQAEMRAAFLAQWNEAQDKRRDDKENRKEERLANVKDMWASRLEWYNTEFPGPEIQPEKTATGMGRSFLSRLGLVNAVESAPAMPDESMYEMGDSEYPEDGQMSDDQIIIGGADFAEDNCLTGSDYGFFVPLSASAGEFCEEDSPLAISVTITPWKSNAEYNQRLDECKTDEAAYQVYLRFWERYRRSPSFFLECADWFYRRGNRTLALRILSNLAEMNLDDPQLLRSLGHRLEHWEQYDESIYVFQSVLRSRPEEPQSWRDLALVVAKRLDKTKVQLEKMKKMYAGLETSIETLARLLEELEKYIEANPAEVGGERAAKALEVRSQMEDLYRNLEKMDELVQDFEARIPLEYQFALELLAVVVWGRDYQDWDDRFPEIEVFALEEINALIPRAKEAGIIAFPIPEQFITPFEVDLRINLTWHADNTDIDLHVIEPSGEEAYYGHRRTRGGGLVSCDYREGYGPEEYLIRKALPGKYIVQANYFSSFAVEILGEICVQADIFTHFGRSNQTCQSLTFSLKDEEETCTIGEITIPEQA